MTLMRTALTRKADFARRLDKERQLSALEVDARSFDWVWSSTFAAWLKSNDSLFWIAGKPASGKSTLVNYLATHENTYDLAGKGIGESVKVARFFFDFRGREGITNNFEGFRRSLLCQLLATSVILAVEVGEHFGVAADEDMFTLSSSDILKFVLRKNTKPLLIFIDGLDEYQGHKSEVVNLVNDILQFDVRICLSSRNEPPFSVAYRDLPHKLFMDRVNRLGIEAHARGRFETTLRPTLYHEKLDIALATGLIAEKSAGVFLWARFAVQEVIDTICDGGKIELPLQRIIDRMPPELEQVYARIFCSFRSDDSKRTCGLMLQLIDAAQQDLRLPALFEAMLIAGDNFRPFTKTMDLNDLVSFQRHIGFVEAGLVEIIPERWVAAEDLGRRLDGRSTRIIHRTVQTYLDKTGWAKLLTEPPTLGSQQKLWIEICTSFLAGKRVKWACKKIGIVQPSPVLCPVYYTNCCREHRPA
jgi:hypothetical protein